MISDTILILLLPGGGVPIGGGGGGRQNNKIPINKNIKDFFSHLPPHPAGTPPPTGGGELK